jgi:hypothetical protein
MGTRMCNPELELVDLFPISTRPHTPMELALAEAGSNHLRPIRAFSSDVDLIDAILEDGDRGDEARGAVEDALRNCAVYKQWQRLMPYLKDVPQISRYRKHRSKNLLAVNGEILNTGGYLDAGQLLYRGGTFVSEQIITDEPSSTSMNPSVARWHALEVGGQIAVLKIAGSRSIRGFAYSTSGNQQLKHEYEVLLQSGLRLEQTSARTVSGILVKSYEAQVL